LPVWSTRPEPALFCSAPMRGLIPTDSFPYLPRPPACPAGCSAPRARARCGRRPSPPGSPFTPLPSARSSPPPRLARRRRRPARRRRRRPWRRCRCRLWRSSCLTCLRLRPTRRRSWTTWRRATGRAACRRATGTAASARCARGRGQGDRGEARGRRRRAPAAVSSPQKKGRRISLRRRTTPVHPRLARTHGGLSLRPRYGRRLPQQAAPASRSRPAPLQEAPGRLGSHSQLLPPHRASLSASRAPLRW
jgi:hypothetical protein